MHTYTHVLWFHFHVGGQASEPWEQAPFSTYRARIENRNSTKCDWSSVKPTSQDSDLLLLGPASTQRDQGGAGCWFLPVPRVGLAWQSLTVLLKRSDVQARQTLKCLDWSLAGNIFANALSLELLTQLVVFEMGNEKTELRNASAHNVFAGEHDPQQPRKGKPVLIVHICGLSP